MSPVPLGWGLLMPTNYMKNMGTEPVASYLCLNGFLKSCPKRGHMHPTLPLPQLSPTPTLSSSSLEGSQVCSWLPRAGRPGLERSKRWWPGSGISDLVHQPNVPAQTPTHTHSLFLPFSLFCTHTQSCHLQGGRKQMPSWPHDTTPHWGHTWFEHHTTGLQSSGAYQMSCVLHTKRWGDHILHVHTSGQAFVMGLAFGQEIGLMDEWCSWQYNYAYNSDATIPAKHLLKHIFHVVTISD